MDLIAEIAEQEDDYKNIYELLGKRINLEDQGDTTTDCTNEAEPLR